MSEELRRVYEEAGLLQYYFDKDVPRDLFRGQSKTEVKQGLPILYPNPGFTRRDGTQRPPDVEIVEVNGNKVVKGCRTIRGEYRGVSTFDRKFTLGAGFTWYKLPKATPIPEALAITQDSDYPAPKQNHYTVAPKNDMPVGLFQVWLDALNKHLVKDE
jgi:hypothetical protein